MFRKYSELCLPVFGHMERVQGLGGKQNECCGETTFDDGSKPCWSSVYSYIFIILITQPIGRCLYKKWNNKVTLYCTFDVYYFPGCSLKIRRPLCSFFSTLQISFQRKSLIKKHLKKWIFVQIKKTLLK